MFRLKKAFIINNFKKKVGDDMTLGEKLSNIQYEMKAPKDLYNSFGKYKYRNAEGILEAFKPLEKKYNVFLILNDSVEIIGDKTYLVAMAQIFDCESDAVYSSKAFAREPLEKKGMDDSQITGSASSYARKYALNGLFLLDDTKDADTNEYNLTQKNDEQRKNALTDIKKEIISTCTQLGGTKNKALMDTLKIYTANGNPNAIRSIEKAKECLEKIRKIKPVE